MGMISDGNHLEYHHTRYNQRPKKAPCSENNGQIVGQLENETDNRKNGVPLDLMPNLLNTGLGFNGAQILHTCCRFYAAALDQ